LRELIDDSVQMRLVSDVPLGAFLSGGIDSSTVVASMSEAVSSPIRTFSIGFEDASYNELPYAREVAAHFRTDHTEEILKPDIGTLAEQLVAHLDEPFADFSIFPTYLVSKLAQQSVKVVLSGDGGDELFGGYDTYVAQHLDRYYRWLPIWLRQRTMPALMAQIPPRQAKKGLINKVKRFVEGGALPQSLQHTRWMIFMNEGEKASLYRPDLRAALDGATLDDLLERHFKTTRSLEPLCQQQYVDIKTYLPDDILTKVDRMSMAVSLEARVPLLDHRIVEFALNLPPHMKLRGLKTKTILREAMADYLPKAILDKPKQGFSIPLKHWLRGPLKSLMTDLLSVESIRRRGYFEPQCVNNWISEHLDYRANHSHRLWALIVFELWHQQVLDERSHLRVNTAPS
jgi:asparagine synthase (glutamine-hydrolysing)